jgi:hypothetical protein
VAELLAQFLYDALDGLGLAGWMSDRHRPWILRVLVVALALISAVIVVAVVMLASGHS